MSQRRETLKGHQNEGLSKASVGLNLASWGGETREQTVKRVNR